jgi:hypothetical protein
MKKHRIFAVLFLLFAFNMVGDSEENAKKVPIGFTESFKAKDLVIKKIIAHKENINVIFTILYESDKDRFLSFFNPPDGDKLLYFDREGIKRNKTSVRFSIAQEEFMDVSEITMRFSDNDNPEQDVNFLYLATFEKDMMDFLGMGEKPTLFKSREKTFNSVEEYQDVRWGDLTQTKQDLSFPLISTLWFNLDTKFGVHSDISKSVLEKGKNPGLGIRALHKRGITGKGVNVAIIDQNLCLNHPEFKGKVVQYKDVGCNQPPNRGSMHAPGVLSLLAGNSIGTAPGVKVYFAAAPSWTADAKYQADALEWIIEVNQSLPQQSKIKVVSISAAPSGKGSPFTNNNEFWDLAVDKAKKQGMLILDCTQHNGIIGPCYYDINDPDDLDKCRVGWPGRPSSSVGPKNLIYVPCSLRTTAEEYLDGYPSFQYTGRGGLSWSIPYVAGVSALGWQIKPDLSANQIVELLFETAHTTNNGHKIINPAAFVDAVEKISR